MSGLTFDEARQVREFYRRLRKELPPGVCADRVEAARAAIRRSGFIPGDVTMEAIQREYESAEVM